MTATRAERRALEALYVWWVNNRDRALPPGLASYYSEPLTRQLVEAAADMCAAHPNAYPIGQSDLLDWTGFEGRDGPVPPRRGGGEAT